MKRIPLDHAVTDRFVETLEVHISLLFPLFHDWRLFQGNMPKARDFAAHLKAGDPGWWDENIKVYQLGPSYLLIDGMHRLIARWINGDEYITVDRFEVVEE